MVLELLVAKGRRASGYSPHSVLVVLGAWMDTDGTDNAVCEGDEPFSPYQILWITIWLMVIAETSEVETRWSGSSEVWSSVTGNPWWKTPLNRRGQEVLVRFVSTLVLDGSRTSNFCRKILVRGHASIT